jgi:hypothetical protein
VRAIPPSHAVDESVDPRLRDFQSGVSEGAGTDCGEIGVPQKIKFKKRYKPIGFGDRPNPGTVEGHRNAIAEVAETRQYNRRMEELEAEDKLVRLCEEINSAYGLQCYYATAMLIRGLLDHVPPVFGFKTFSEVANNYAGGGKSFKETIHHLENASRKVGDAHLHMPIRKSEILPTAQLVNCGQQLDVLLSEIVRITR